MILTVCVCNGMRSWKNRSGLKQGRVNHTFETSLFIAVVQKKKCCEKRAGGGKREDWAFYFRFACVIFATSLTSKNLAKASLKPRVSFYFKKLTLKPPSPSSSSPPPPLDPIPCLLSRDGGFLILITKQFSEFRFARDLAKGISSNIHKLFDKGRLISNIQIPWNWSLSLFFSYFTSRGLGPISSNYRVP